MRTQWPEHARLPILLELAGHQTCTGQKDSSSNGSKKREPEEQAGSLSAHRAPQTKRSRGMHAPVLCISTYILVAKVYDYSLNCEDIAFVLPYNNLPGGEPLATAKWRRPQLLSFSFFFIIISSALQASFSRLVLRSSWYREINDARGLFRFLRLEKRKFRRQKQGRKREIPGRLRVSLNWPPYIRQGTS